MVIAISAGHEIGKKSNNVIREKIRYLNYGLLGLASILKHQGNIDVLVFQADSYDVETLLSVIESCGINIATDCESFLLSIPSYYSMSWCVNFCNIVKQRYNKPIIVGGRWVVDGHVDWVTSKLRYADTIVDGFGERKLAQLFNFPGWERIQSGSTKCFDYLDYELLYDYKKYQPCIEISRGCGSGCQFCADKNNVRLPNKAVDTVMAELDNLDRLYNQYSVYFEAPHFAFERKWIYQLCENIFSRDRSFLWRCTSRVESVPLDLLGIMGEEGLKVLDIGLESASPQQLINMRKTRHPNEYLERAEKLLLECAKNHIWVKFNLLLYAGETYDTISETIKWLVDRKELIKDVSVSSLVYYYNMDSIAELQKLGASIPLDEDITKTGFVDLNLSDSIDRNAAKKISIDIPKLIATQKDFYDVKAISYFEPGYSYNEYLEDLKLCDYTDLPFSIE